MEQEIITRQAIRADLDGIMRIETSCFGPDSFSKKQFVYLITKAKGMFYVVEYQERIVAYVSLLQNDHTPICASILYAVHPGFRRQKLGQHLIDKTIEFARLHNHPKITLEVNVSNPAALRLYQKQIRTGPHNKQLLCGRFERLFHAPGSRLFIDLCSISAARSHFDLQLTVGGNRMISFL